MEFDVQIACYCWSLSRPNPEPRRSLQVLDFAISVNYCHDCGMIPRDFGTRILQLLERASVGQNTGISKGDIVDLIEFYAPSAPEVLDISKVSPRVGKAVKGVSTKEKGVLLGQGSPPTPRVGHVCNLDMGYGDAI
jgi:hypothetical protein